MDDKITIIEGPTPVFEKTREGWALGAADNAGYFTTSVTRLRTANAQALVERCHRTWFDGHTMFLHFRDRMGLEDRVPIVAIRSVDTDDGQVLMLWCRRTPGSQDDEVDDDFEDQDDDFDDDDTQE